MVSSPAGRRRRFTVRDVPDAPGGHTAAAVQVIGHAFGLHVNTRTINNPFAARTVAAAAVDSITTDRVRLVRVALHSADPPDPRLRAGRPLRAVVRISPC
jgi:hypothetical protein